MDASLAERLISLASKTDSFAQLTPELLPQREITASQMAAVLGLATARPDVHIAALGRALAPRSARLRWQQVLAVCDTQASEYPLILRSAESTVALFTLLGTISVDAVHAMLARKWSTLLIQNSLLAGIMMVPQQQLGLPNYGIERVVTDGPLLLHPMNFVSVIHMALDAVVREAPTDLTAKTFLDGHVKLAPELFLIGGVTMPEPWAPVLERILINLYALYFREMADPGSPALARVAALNPRFMYLASFDLYARDATQLDRIAMSAHSVGLLDSWLDQSAKNGYGFTLELIAACDRLGLASARSLLVSKFVTGGPDAITALLDFMDVKVSAAAAVAGGGAAASEPNLLSLRTVAAFETLTSSIDVPPDRMKQLQGIQIQCLQSYPRLINFGQGHDEAILANNDLPTFPPEVEQEMKMWFQKMYEQQIEIRDVISLLESLKESDEPRSQDLFACMAHSLFDEYRFFPEYPVNALATTAVLFGSLVRFRLIDNIPLSIALRLILESLNQPVETNMFRFGLQALFELRQRLPEFPKYCSVLLTIPGLVSQQQFYQQIKDIVYPSSTIELAVEDNSFKSLNSDMGSKMNSSAEVPNDQVKDKVLFVVNNLSPHNVQSKAKELIGMLDQRYHDWFAKYIVGERAISEPNYHGLYISMLSSLNSQNLLVHCCHVAYIYIIRIVNDPNVLAQNKRTELKNLGSFLGSLMLANNRPIAHDNINFKLLLAEATHQEKIPAVLPFVCKVLEKSANSLVFAPPNAWLMGLMAVLSELYSFGQLKLNLKFEIEALCNALSLKIEEIEPSHFIRNSDAVQLEQDMSVLRIEERSNAIDFDFSPQLAQPTAGSAAATHLPGMAPPSSGSGGAVLSTANTSAATAASWPTALQFAGNTEFVVNPHLRRFLEIALSKTVQDVLIPVIDRSASIASYTSHELVSKDFALDPHEHRLQTSGYNLASLLAVSMSLVTAKDAFAESFATNLRNLLLSNGYADNHPLLEQVPIVARDNIDVVIPLIEAAAHEKAIADMDDAMVPSIQQRQHFNSLGPTDRIFAEAGKPFYPVQLPDPLALHPGGLTPQQLSIYNDFTLSNGQGSVGPEAPGAAPQALTEKAMHKMQGDIDSLEKLVSESNAKSLVSLKRDDKILALMSQILSTAGRPPVRDEVTLKTSQLVVSAMFSPSANQLGREAMCFLLGKLCEMSALTAKEVVLWLIYSDDERKCNVQVMGTLIKSKLISATEIDVNLAKEILNHNSGAITFAAGLIMDSVLGPSPYSLRTEFTGSLEAMEVLAREGQPNAAAKGVLAALHKSRGEGWEPASDSANNSEKTSGAAGTPGRNEVLLNKMGYVFAEWARLVRHPCSTERSLHIFVYGLAEQKVLSHTEPLYALIRIGLETSVESYRSSEVTAGVFEASIGVDALAKLLITIMQTSDRMPLPARMQYAQGLLLVLSLVMAKDHEDKNTKFNGRPYFRLWSTLLFHLSEVDDGSPFWTNLLLHIAEIFETLQPVAFPAFSSSWMSLISHRHFMPRLLAISDRGEKSWQSMTNLLSVLLKFLLLVADPQGSDELLSVTYSGVLRIFLVILYDFPDFLVAQHFQLVSEIPSSFSQLRNIVSSAFPSGMELPGQLAGAASNADDREPPPASGAAQAFASHLGIDKLVDQAIQQRPGAITPQLVGAITSSLVLPSRVPDRGVLFSEAAVSGAGYNALMVYVASTITGEDVRADESSPQTVLLIRLLSTLNAEARYFAVSAIVNHLRYPNRQTHFFSQLLLALFTPSAQPLLKDNAEATRQAASRVLLERIISNRPHPWGLLTTFSQLLSDKKYQFWDQRFLEQDLEAEKMFASLFQHISGATS